MTSRFNTYKFVLLIMLYGTNVSREQSIGSNNATISDVSKKLEEIRQSNSDNAEYLEMQLTQLKLNQDGLQDFTSKLRALAEDIRKSDASNKILLRDLSGKFPVIEDARNPGFLVYDASKTGNTYRLRLLLNSDSLRNYTDAKGNGPIHVAIKNFHPEVLRILLNYHEADVEDSGEKDYTPLHWASQNDCLECAKILLERGASVYSRNDWKETPLIIAAKNGYTDLVKLLLEYGAEINVKQDKDSTALHLASREGKIDTVKVLVAHNANLTARNSDGQTALDLAFLHEHDEVVHFLRNLLNRSGFSLRN